MTTGKTIPGYGGYTLYPDGRCWSHLRHCWMRVSYRNKYPSFTLVSDDGKRKTKKLHRLLGEVFIPNPHDERCVLHRDDNPLNWELDNLYWGSYTDNYNDRVKLGTNGIYPPGPTPKPQRPPQPGWMDKPTPQGKPRVGRGRYRRDPGC